jgi:colanic acid/amylovoran biosynthesis glycosyltransferase
MMRVAYILNSFPALSQTFVRNEIRGLIARGLAIDVFPLRPAVPDEAGLVASEPDLPSGFRLHPVSDIETLAEVIGSGPYDHIHAHFAVQPAAAARLVAARARRTYSVTAHAVDIFKENPDLLANLEGAAFVVTVSEYNRAHLRRLGVTAEIQVIPCGVDVRVFARRRPYPAAGRLVLAIGRLVPKKGFDVLVRACGQLRDAGVPYRCAIVGSGRQRECLEELIAALGLGDHVSLEGPKAQIDVRDAFEACRLFVLPAVVTADGNRDGIPQVLKEAMAMEVPVVTTSTSGIPELVDGACGLVVRPGDVAELAGAIGRLLEARPARLRALGRAGRARVLGGHTLELQVERMYRLLTEMGGAGRA